MNRAWKDRTSKDPEYAQKRVYAKEAYHAKCFIYSRSTKQWYTPEEFMASDERVVIRRGKEELGVFLIIDPILAYKQKLELIVKLQNEAAEFKSKAEGYLSNRK